jgi:hypothetical protein
MTTTKDKIAKVCNYKDDDKISGNNVITGMYVGFSIESNEKILLEKKRKRRELKINEVLDEEVDNITEDQNGLEWGSTLIPDEFEFESVIAPKLYSMNYTATKFIDYDDLYNNIINFLESRTLNPMSNRSTVFPNISLTGLDVNNIVRKLTSRIMMGSSMIAVEGRVGPATSALIGDNLRQYFSSDEIGGIKLIFESNIDPDKIILCRGGKTDQEGIHVINDSDNNYFMKETPNWENQYLWFSAK